MTVLLCIRGRTVRVIVLIDRLPPRNNENYRFLRINRRVNGWIVLVCLLYRRILCTSMLLVIRCTLYVSSTMVVFDCEATQFQILNSSAVTLMRLGEKRRCIVCILLYES